MKVKFLILAVLSILITIETARAYGMASSYLENKTMFMLPGETRDYTIELQNADSREVAFVFELEGEIAEIVQKENKYYVGGNNIVVPILIRITMPENAYPGQKYSINYTSYPINEVTQQINLNFKFRDSFTAISTALEKEEEIRKEANYIFIVPFIPILVLIGLLIFKKNSLLFRRLLKK